MNFKNEVKSLFIGEGFSEVRVLKDFHSDKSIIIGAFPYEVRSDSDLTGVKISPFAQKNHYGEAVKRLKKISLFIRGKNSLKKSDIRIFCNSRLEEKWYAANSGLGFYGKNSLIITKRSGSRVILAGIIIPINLEPDEKLEKAEFPGEICGSCNICLKKCPTSAIETNGFINRDKCLQSLTTDERVLQENILEKWGNRLYGCSICQDCCPYNKNRIEGNTDITGFLGRSVPFEFLLKSDDVTLKNFFKGTALSMSWIKLDLLRRNAIISTVAERRIDLIVLIEKFLAHKNLSYSAQWALNKLNQFLETDK